MTTESKEYHDGILSAWQGEQWGRLFFDRLAEAAEDAGYRAKWEVLAELEAATGDVLAPLVAVDAEPPPHDERPQIEAAAAAYGRLSYADAMQQMMTILDPAIERFRRLLAIAPETDREVVQILVDHEVALKQFAERELAGASETSLDPVRAVISRARARGLTREAP